MLRAWRTADASSLASAWTDPEIRHWLDPPEASTAEARRWIDGWERRRLQRLALDLVIDVDGRVAGEVGLSSFDRRRRAALVGYWVAPADRGAGLGASALAAVTRWFLDPTGPIAGRALMAECAVANVGSVRTAERAGFEELGHRGALVVLARRLHD